MSKAAAATVDALAVEPGPKRGKKKLIVIGAAVLALLLAGGTGAVVYLKQKAAAAAAAEEDGEEADPAAAAEARRREMAKHPPTFVPLEPFVVNLADKESDRYAQIGVTLEVEDAQFAEEMKAYMPAIRNGILMVLSHKTSTQLLSREGKVALAREIMRESVLPLGFEVRDEAPAAAASDEEELDEDGNPVARKAKAGPASPVRRVHFSNFIVQ